jgi:predicted MFS family arabinose efflux permease
MIAGYSIEYAGFGTAFLIFAAFTLFPIAVLTFRRDIARVATPAAPAIEKRSAFDLLRTPQIARVILVSGLIVAAWELYIFYVPVVAHTIGLPPSTIGIILGAFAAATFLIRFAIPVLLKWLRVERMLTVSALVAASAFVVFPFLRDPYALIAASFVVGLGLGCGQPLSMTLSFDRSPAGRTGEVTGLRLIANNLARSAVPVLSGALGAAFGTTPVFWMNALSLVTASYLARK